MYKGLITDETEPSAEEMKCQLKSYKQKLEHQVNVNINFLRLILKIFSGFVLLLLLKFISVSESTTLTISILGGLYMIYLIFFLQKKIHTIEALSESIKNFDAFYDYVLAGIKFNKKVEER